MKAPRRWPYKARSVRSVRRRALSWPLPMKAASAVCGASALWSPMMPRTAANTDTSRSGTTR